MDIKDILKEKIEILNKAAYAYYQEGKEIMSNLEYDKLYDELEALEKSSGIVLSNSPTQRVGYEIMSELPKEKHNRRMLSLDKTKSVETLENFLGEETGLLSWKLDGLTVVLTYENGILSKALTRGNGDIGEVITNNAKTFSNVPLSVPFNGRLVIRGEAIITYSEFEKINSQIGDADAKYKNPRNLCSGSVRQLNPNITKSRNVKFIVFSLVEAISDEKSISKDLHSTELNWMREIGFDVVEFEKVDKTNVAKAVSDMAEKVKINDFPSDGLVLTYDDIEYGKSLGATTKFPRDAIAFKWADQMEETTLKEIEWSASRTGLINPIAVFNPVELEGTTVSRASVHNISIMKELKLGIGDTIKVYKANMIIPQIAENITGSDNIEIPDKCPVCQGNAIIKDENGIKTLYCTNTECAAKHLKGFSLFVSRNALNIEGLSEATLEKFIAKGFIHKLGDLFHLKAFEEEIIAMEGFGKKSFDNLMASIEKASHTEPNRLLYGLGISGIGVANANVIARHCDNKWSKIQGLSKEELLTIEGIGDVMANAYVEYFANENKREVIEELLQSLDLDEISEEREDFLSGITFVITGNLKHYENRDTLKNKIEKAGGKVAGSVSKKTSYLINNDVNSTSGKNKKARELGIEIIDENVIKNWLESKHIQRVE